MKKKKLISTLHFTILKYSYFFVIKELLSSDTDIETFVILYLTIVAQIKEVLLW